MPTFAILGATGATGGSILQLLLETPKSEEHVALHIYVRSRAKLLRQSPLLSSRDDVHIFEGSVDDTSALSACLAGTDVIFSCVAQNESAPGMDIAQETSKRIISTLKKAKADQSNFRAPHVIVLSAAPVNPVLAAKMPSFVRWLVTRAYSHVYADLRVAEQMYRDEKDWLPVTFVQPPGLTQDVSYGRRLHHGEGALVAFISYLDLAAAMIDVAHRGPDDHYDWVSVASPGKGPKPKLNILLPSQIKGLMAHFAPGLWRTLRARDWI